MIEPAPDRKLTALLLALPAVKLLVHLAAMGGYGYFRDEFYYLACSRELAWGYVDQPPLSLLLLWLARNLLGESLFALRLLPALAGAATVLLVGLMARELGGGRFAQALAMVAAIAAPIYLALNHIFSMNAFDVLLWALAAYLLIRILGGGEARLWLALGVVLGLGLENKISVLWLGFGLAVGLLATPERRRLASRWPWLALAISSLLFVPHLLWQVAHGWPTLEFMANATGQKMAGVAPLEFLSGQILVMNPATLPVWLAGLAFFFAHDGGRRYRLLGWTYLAVFLLLMASGTARANYLAPAYTWLFAGGGVAIEGWLARLGWPLVKEALVTLVVAAGVVLAPFGLPILPVPTYVAYADALGIAPRTDEKKELAELPQHYADMHGWEAMVATVAEVYQRLPPEDQARAVIFGQNYGQAGAVDLLGKEHGLPPAVSGHNNYWLWGPRGRDGSVVILIGGNPERLAEVFEEVERAATIECGYCMPYENHQPVWVARRMKLPLAEFWPRLKHFD